YRYQADTRRGEPAERAEPRLVPRGGARAGYLRESGGGGPGASALSHHPWESTGPWFSGDRPQWQMNQLQLMQGAGIDVALPVYEGDAASRKEGALTGLSAMMEGVRELEAAPSAASGIRSFPQIGLTLDLEALARQYGGPVDLRDAEAQRSLYGMLREVALRVPAG